MKVGCEWDAASRPSRVIHHEPVKDQPQMISFHCLYSSLNVFNKMNRENEAGEGSSSSSREAKRGRQGRVEEEEEEER